jgi:hypothetical protein
MIKIDFNKIYNKDYFLTIVNEIEKKDEYYFFIEKFSSEKYLYNYIRDFGYRATTLPNGNKIEEGLKFYGYNINDWENQKHNRLFLESIIEDIKEDVEIFDENIKFNYSKNDIFDLFTDFEKNEVKNIRKVEIDHDKLVNYKKDWIRLYGIKIDNNQIIISGGLIKLTNKMQGIYPGKIEDDKLNDALNFFEKKINNKN